jgi:hypothetical protein
LFRQWIHSWTWVVAMYRTTVESEASGPSLDDGTAADMDTVSLAALEAELCGWAGRIAAATCRMFAVLAAFDRRGGWSGLGMSSCAHWLAWRCGLSVRTAQQHVAVARALEDLPAVRSAFGAGRLSYSKVRAVARVADAESDECWLNHALHCTAGQLERLASRYHQLTADPASQHAAQRVSWRRDSAGMFRLSAVLTAEEGARLTAAIDAARASMDDSSGVADDETASGRANTAMMAPSRDRRADADALVALADGFLSRPAPGLMAPLHTLTVHLDAETLLAAHGDATGPVRADRATRPGQTDRRAAPKGEALPEGEPAGPISRQVDGGAECPTRQPDEETVDASSRADRLARGLLRCDVGSGIGLPRKVLSRLGCDALIRPLLRDDSGSPLALGRRQRVPTPRLRDAVYARDQGICQYPGCDRTRWLQVHHLRAWFADGGDTDLENLTLLCSRHHRSIHEEGIRLERRDNRIVAVLRNGLVVLPSPRLDPGSRPAGDLTMAVGPIAPDAIQTRDGGRLSWDSSMLVIMQHRRPPEPPPPSRAA